MKLDDLRTEAQSVLDELWATELIPFELTAHKVESLGAEEYIIRFHDSRVRSVDISWKNQECFKEAVRANRGGIGIVYYVVALIMPQHHRLL